MDDNLIKNFLSYIEVQKRYSPRTKALYEEALLDYCAFSGIEVGENFNIAEGNTFKNQQVTDQQLMENLQPQLIRGYIAAGLKNGKSARTMNLKLSALSSFCNYLLKLSVLESNPVSKVYRPKEKKRLPEFYTEKSLDKYFEQIEERRLGDFFSYRNMMVIMLLYTTGMRRAEVVSLRISDLDQSRSLFRIKGKGGKMREIPIPISFLSEILLYLKRINEELPDRLTNAFFFTEKGKDIYNELVNKIVKTELGGDDGFFGKKSPHVLRHSLATHLLNNGADINSIKEVLGHSSLAATQVYTHNSFEKLKKTFLTAHPRAKKGGQNGN